MSNAQQSTALAVVQSQQPHDITIGPSNMGELQQLAAAAAGSTFYGAKTKEQALLLMMTGKDLGLSYTQALCTFHVIEGRPAMSADGMVAICLGSKLCEYFRTVESTPESCTVETKRVNCPAARLTFTMNEAKQAGLAGRGNWNKYPAAMLRARAKSALARDVYPDLLAGIYDPDEIDTVKQAQVVDLVPMARQTPTEPPITEPTKVEQEELFEILQTGIMRCQSVAALEKFGAEDVKPKAADLGKRLKGKLQTCYRDQHDKLSLEERGRAAAVDEDPRAEEQDEPGAAG